uniref:Uncharacterized protein n=1 Tax=Amphimedon queenslandica TaxID=400682 RepID=A0A1X7UZK2_AMPQE
GHIVVHVYHMYMNVFGGLLLIITGNCISP